MVVVAAIFFVSNSVEEYALYCLLFLQTKTRFGVNNNHHHEITRRPEATIWYHHWISAFPISHLTKLLVPICYVCRIRFNPIQFPNCSRFCFPFPPLIIMISDLFPVDPPKFLTTTATPSLQPTTATSWFLQQSFNLRVVNKNSADEIVFVSCSNSIQ